MNCLQNNNTSTIVNNDPSDEDDPLQLVDHNFVKYLFQTQQEIDDEFAARREELRAWSEHSEKRGLVQHFFVDNREINKPSNMLELLYYCPNKSARCIILDFRGYIRLLEQRKTHRNPLAARRMCGLAAEVFQRFLPRKEYIEKYGEAYSRQLKARLKSK